MNAAWAFLPKSVAAVDTKLWALQMSNPESFPPRLGRKLIVELKPGARRAAYRPTPQGFPLKRKGPQRDSARSWSPRNDLQAAPGEPKDLKFATPPSLTSKSELWSGLGPDPCRLARFEGFVREASSSSTLPLPPPPHLCLWSGPLVPRKNRPCPFRKPEAPFLPAERQRITQDPSIKRPAPKKAASVSLPPPLLSLERGKIKQIIIKEPR